MTGAIVVGAGMAGMAAAYHLHEQGIDVHVLERADHVGGRASCDRTHDGWTINRGATVLAASYDALLGLADDLGVRDEIVVEPVTVGVVADGRVNRLRTSGLGALIDFLRTPLLPARSKVRIARLGVDALRSRRRAGWERPDLRAQLDVESVGDYCARRLDTTIGERLLAPLLGGLYVADGSRMSVADLWFTLTKLLSGGMLGYRAGIDFLPLAIAERVPVTLGADVSLIERSGHGARVHWQDRDGVHHADDVDGVVLAVPAPAIGALYPELDSDMQAILNEGLLQANLYGIRFGLTCPPSGDTTLIVVPSAELQGVATILFEHRISPESCPPGAGLLGVLLYHEWVSERADWSDEQIIEAIVPELERVVPGLIDTIAFADLTRWQPGALRSEPGQHRVVAEAHERLDPSDPVQLAGDWLGIPSTNGAVIAGQAAAGRLVSLIGQRAAQPVGER